jgi:hypothetical protein
MLAVFTLCLREGLTLSTHQLAISLQERVQIQKYVCQACTHTWRSDG